MKQKQLRTVRELITAATKASGGANEHGAAIGLVFGAKLNIDADLTRLIVARDQCDTAKRELSEKRQALRASTLDAVRFVTAVRDILKLSLGSQPSSAWTGTGFETSFKVPRNPDGIRERVRLLKTFLTNRRTAEVPQLELTSAKAEVLVQEITTAQNEVNYQRTTVADLLATRRTREKAMQKRISGLTEELGRLIEPLDPRWLSFGLKKPGAKETPEIPQDVTIIPIEPDGAAVQWKAAPRASYYRVWLKVDGIDKEARAIGSPADLDFLLEQLPPHSTVEVAVSAVNDGGESARSSFVSLTLDGRL